MIIKLLTKRRENIQINNIEKINVYIDKLKKITKKNPITVFEDKLKSLLVSETFLSLFTEGEISSRRDIRNIFSDKNISPKTGNQMIKNFLLAFKFVLDKREISISNLYTLYNLLSQDVLEDHDKLKDGYMYRHDIVYIKSNKLNGDFEGFDVKDIPEALNNLLDFLLDTKYDIYFRSIVGHIYFELIHPYFDYNGRTGRFLPLWLFSNEGKKENMLYFATAIGNYRNQYLSLFRKNIDNRTYKVNMDNMVMGILKLLIKNQYQYIWIKNQENKYIKKHNKSFSNFQKDFLWLLLKKAETTQNNNSFFKLSKEDKEFLDKDLRNATLSTDCRLLQEANIIKITNDKPRKYKLINYDLVDFDKI